MFTYQMVYEFNGTLSTVHLALDQQVLQAVSQKRKAKQDQRNE